MLHWYPLYSGCGALANSSPVQRLAGESNEMVWARMRNGCLLRVALDDFNGRGAFYVGDIDRKITTVCTRIVRPGDIALDIGSNIGLVTFAIAPIVGAGGHVHAFEPNPDLRQSLSCSIRKNQSHNVTLHRFALGERTDSLELTVDRRHTGRGSLVREWSGPRVTRTTVPVRPLSDVLDELSIRHIRLVKIDVEGFESQVLRGARAAFSADPPDAIVVELNDRAGSVRDHPTVKLLREFGYVFFVLPKGLLRVRPRLFDPDRHRYTGSDLIAVQQGALNEVAKRLGAVR